VLRQIPQGTDRFGIKNRGSKLVKFPGEVKNYFIRTGGGPEAGGSVTLFRGRQ